MISGLSAAFASPAAGAPLTFQFTGVIDFVEDGLPISDQVPVGASYSGIYVFNPVGVPDTNDDPQIGRYNFGAGGFMSVDISGSSFSTTDLSITIWNLSPLVDIYQAGNSNPFVVQGTQWLGMGLDLRDSTDMAFDSTELPLTPPDLDEFEFSKRFAMWQFDRRFPSITGTVTSLTMIPEPSSLSMLFTATALLSLHRRPSNGAAREHHPVPSK